MTFKFNFVFIYSPFPLYSFQHSFYSKLNKEILNVRILIYL